MKRIRRPASCGAISSSSARTRSNSATAVRGVPTRRVGAAERRVDVRARDRCDEIGCDRRLELLDRLGVVAPARGRQAERDVNSRRGAVVRFLRRLGEDLVQLVELDLVVEPDAKLELGQPELAQLAPAERRSELEVVGRHPELPGEHPQRLDRRVAQSGFDPRDVRVADPRSREVALGEAPLSADAPQALADGLGSRLVRHRRGMIAKTRIGVNKAATRLDNKRQPQSDLKTPVSKN